MVNGLVTYVGCRALYAVTPTFLVAVTIRDMREMFGRRDALIEPAKGNGERWVSLDNLNDITK